MIVNDVILIDDDVSLLQLKLIIQYIKNILIEASNIFQDKMININQKTAQLSNSQQSSSSQPIDLITITKQKGQETHLQKDEKIFSDGHLPVDLSQQKQKRASIEVFKKSKKIISKNVNEQIFETIRSADKIIKLLLIYNHKELQKDFSKYLLNKQKLFYYVENDILLHNTSNNLYLTQMTTKKKYYKPKEHDSEETEQIPINHLQRLQRIVYNKIIPLLQTDYYSSKKHFKMNKKNPYPDNNQLQDGLRLLERLQEKETIALDQCSQVLQRFINKTIERQDKMMKKIQKLQKKIQVQTGKKNQKASSSKKLFSDGIKSIDQSDKSKKKSTIYEQFYKSINTTFLSHNKILPNLSNQQTLKAMLSQIDQLLANDSQSQKKKCQHKIMKQSLQKQQINLFQSQIKTLKQTIKTLDDQLLSIKHDCQSIQQKYRAEHQMMHKLQQKDHKIQQQLQMLNKRNDEYIQQIRYKNKLIQNYLELVNKFQDDIKQKEEIIHNLRQENVQLNQNILKNVEEKQQYLQHIIKYQERIKQEQNLMENKIKEMEDMEEEMNQKLKEVNELQIKIKHIQKENKQLKDDLVIKNGIIEEYEMLRIRKSIALQDKDSWRDKSGSVKNKAFVAEQLIISVHQERQNAQSQPQNNLEHSNNKILSQQLQQTEQKINQLKQQDIPIQQQKQQIYKGACMIIEKNDYNSNIGKKREDIEDYVPGAIDQQDLGYIKNFYLITTKPKYQEKTFVVLKQDYVQYKEEVDNKQDLIQYQKNTQQIQQQNSSHAIQLNQLNNQTNRIQHAQNALPVVINYEQLQKLKKIYIKITQQGQNIEQNLQKQLQQKINQQDNRKSRIIEQQQGNIIQLDYQEAQIRVKQGQLQNVGYIQVDKKEQLIIQGVYEIKQEEERQEADENKKQKEEEGRQDAQLQNIEGKTLKDDIIQLQNANIFHEQFKYIQNMEQSQQKSLPNQQDQVKQVQSLQHTKSKSVVDNKFQPKLPNILSQQQQQDDNLDQLLKTYKTINEKILSIQGHIKNCANYPQEVNICQQQLKVILNFLILNKKNIIKQYKIIKISQQLRKKADNQVLKLKHYFNDAFLADINQSSIMEAYNDSNNSFHDGLQIFLQSKQNENQNILNQIQFQIKKLSSRDLLQQESIGSKNPTPSMQSWQKKSINQRQLDRQFDDMSPIKKSTQQNLNKSLLDLVQNFNNKQSSQHQAILDLNFKQILIQNQIQEEDKKKKEINPQVLDKAIQTNQKQNGGPQFDSIGNMINYHKEQILNLHQLLRTHTTSYQQQKTDQIQIQSFQTPIKTPLIDKSQFIQDISKAPQKQQKQASIKFASQAKPQSIAIAPSQAKILPFKADEADLVRITLQKQFQIEQLKLLISNRQFELSELIRQKDNEIQRLKSIINTLTNIQIKEDRPRSIHNSRLKQQIDFQKQNLKRQNQELKNQDEQLRMEIQRLNIKIKHYQLNQEIMKIKISNKDSIRRQTENLQAENKDKNQQVISQVKYRESKARIDGQKVIGTENEYLKQEDDRLSKLSKLSDEKEGASKINKIVRKGKGTKHKAALFSIEDLVPEYYGKKHE